MVFLLLVLVVSIPSFMDENQENPPAVPVNANKENDNLAQQLDPLIQNEDIVNQGIIGISIRSATTGELLYDHLGDIRLRPASNLKLLTATAALATLGENYTFTTEVLTDGTINGDRLEGNLYLKGKGDPTLLATDIDEMAKIIRQKGITKIDGSIIGDDQWYDNERYSPDLIWSDEQFYYGAPISALTAAPNQDYDSGTVIVRVKPANKSGKKPTITVTPKTDIVQVVNDAKTVTEEHTEELSITRQHDSNMIKIKGVIPVGANPTKEWISVSNPTEYALQLFSQSLHKRGITYSEDVTQGKTPEEAKPLLSQPSIPLKQLMVPFMKLSNNGHAETLVKEMGKIIDNEGSWDAGIEVVLDQLDNFNVNKDALVIRDGSGISHINLIPANEITKLLYHIQDEEWFSVFKQALPVAGVDERMVGGTLRYRMRDIAKSATIHAKTGTITTVSGLSGYLETKTGEKFIFSILINNVQEDADVKQLEDRIVAALAASK
ncbi:D-alanyl-D-alanine carboxypeptidase/D-alanyl-D-alanine endopeptidase [Aquibacillus sediminis]|uniref:D-alanyl-D-alanine carboxypeptidase/D-alanyl-D-alanine endopeptidase n=1 Tax=Aquibacillus sediminis TaxID=2574734 RepID=UPI003CCC6F8B